MPHKNQICALTSDQIASFYTLNLTSKGKPELIHESSYAFYLDEITDIRMLKDTADMDNKFAVVCSNSELLKVINLDTSEITLLKGHTDLIIAVDTFQDYVVSASKDQTARLWKLTYNYESDKVSGKCVAIFSGHTMSLSGVSMDPKRGTFMVTSSQDNTVKRWDIG